MTHNELISAISKLVVRPSDPEDPNAPVVGRPIYQDAAIMFLRGGAGGWHWHNGRPWMPPVDEGPARDEFVQWLQKASGKAMEAYIENMGRYRTALNAAIAAGGKLPLPKVFVPGTSWPPPRPAEEWRKTQHYAALLISEAKKTDLRELSAKGGRSGRAKVRNKTDEMVLTAARDVLAKNGQKAAPSRWNAAGKIAEALNNKPEQKHVDGILARLACDPANKLPAKWIPRTASRKDVT